MERTSSKYTYMMHIIYIINFLYQIITSSLFDSPNSSTTVHTSLVKMKMVYFQLMNPHSHMASLKASSTL